jgi:hypothetical protein
MQFLRYRVCGFGRSNPAEDGFRYNNRIALGVEDVGRTAEALKGAKAPACDHDQARFGEARE